MRELILCIIYFIWVLAILDLIAWEAPKCTKNTAKCRRMNKNVGFDYGAIFITPLGVEQLIYFLPMMVSTFWKSYVILESKNAVDDEILVLEELIDMQCKAEIFASFYFFVETIVINSYDLVMEFDKMKFDWGDFLKWWACVGLIIAYLGVKYGWSLAMRIAFWKTHLFLDKINKILGASARKFYHLYIYGNIIRLAHKPLKQRYSRKYGLYFDLM